MSIDIGAFRRFYGDAYNDIEALRDELLASAGEISDALDDGEDHHAIEHIKARIKTPESMCEKLRRKELPETCTAALSAVRDVVGLRVVCTFTDCVYSVARLFRERYEVIEEKDYIANPKPNGYRSLHLILHFPALAGLREYDLYAEIQLRTIAMDCWASLEHQMKYKCDVSARDRVVAELRRCADELASADRSMQALHAMLTEDASEALVIE